MRARLQGSGRRAFLAPALPGVHPATIGGVGVATATDISHGPPATLPSSILVAGRITLRHVDGLVPGGILMGSIYMPVRRKQAGRKASDDAFKDLGRFLAQLNRPYIIG